MDVQSPYHHLFSPYGRIYSYALVDVVCVHSDNYNYFTPLRTLSSNAFSNLIPLERSTNPVRTHNRKLENPYLKRTNEVSFLGHIIRPGQILPDPAKIACIEQFPLPMNSHQLHSFLGLINYLRDFMPNLADHTAVLHAALAPNSTAEKAYYKALKMHKGHLPDGWTGWTWSFGPAEQAAFEAVRRAVSTVPCLTVIDYDAVKAGTQKVFLFTDASNTGTGAWISVGTSRDSVQPVAYNSRTFNSAQSNYPVVSAEPLPPLVLTIW
ncbi:hypothetical protein CNBA3490 [Cryptococcus deneoformans B-3501A]|uniref:hypothetical protein n=1 Tax=Cryptococcus deneoformans (strain B-3501A) TaxID=283643 RepID=UPI000042DEA8|nr:hypothetical protein CNBA3490 [Cryptococcus neoformans var. neoformans B-3501A]EAL23702.1 hypothetical protein CNBA3490 [Cryptococcus neoformans var. neoformans B-3501A]